MHFYVHPLCSAIQAAFELAPNDHGNRKVFNVRKGLDFITLDDGSKDAFTSCRLYPPSELEDIMAKEQKRGNREIRKPKKPKAPAVVPEGLIKGIPASSGSPKKKG